MVEVSDLVLAAIPALALAGPVVTAVARLLESAAGVGGGLTSLPLTPAGLVAALLVIGVAMFVVPVNRGQAKRTDQQ